MKTYPVAVLVGSLRRESINRQLATAMTKLAPASLSFYTVELGELPLYNGDLEESRPESVTRFTAQCARADAFFIVTPEHNRSLPAALKNALDWGSKPMDQNVWRDKPVALSGASPGGAGTAIGQQHLRQIMGSILGSAVLGGEIYITYKPELIDAQGNIAIESTRQFLTTYMERFAAFVAKNVG